MGARSTGLETEYAIAFSPSDHNSSKPTNYDIFLALKESIKKIVKSSPGDSSVAAERFFVENGGSFYYEVIPTQFTSGLIEGATPECRSAAELLLYQKAQDQLLIKAIPLAQQLLTKRGYTGQVALLKNCRDAQGHIYGAQENYETPIATGAALWAYRAAISLLIPVVFVAVIMYWTLLLCLLPMMLVFLLGYSTVHQYLLKKSPSGKDNFYTRVLQPFSFLVLKLELLVSFPITLAFYWITRWFCFKTIRAHCNAFLISRPIFTGCGTLLDPRRFYLSEKASAIKRELRYTISQHQRPIYETGHLIKQLLSPFYFHFRPFLNLYRQNQRLQIGLSDSNMAQTAEYLKIATTCLILDMAEAHFLEDAPHLDQPIQALHLVCEDPSLSAKVRLKNGTNMSALEIQKYYLQKAKAYIHSSSAISLQNTTTVRMWEETLSLLENQPQQCFGQIDWITKSYLIDHIGANKPFEVMKKIDLRYHELDQGYFAKLEQAELSHVLVSPQQIAAAIFEPPRHNKARIRSHFIKTMSNKVILTWDYAKFSKKWLNKNKTVFFEHYRPDHTHFV